MYVYKKTNTNRRTCFPLFMEGPSWALSWVSAFLPTVLWAKQTTTDTQWLPPDHLGIITAMGTHEKQMCWTEGEAYCKGRSLLLLALMKCSKLGSLEFMKKTTTNDNISNSREAMEGEEGSQKTSTKGICFYTCFESSAGAWSVILASWEDAQRDGR